MTKEGFFSGLTVVIYSFVAVFSLVAVVLGWTWATGGFDEENIPVTSLQFSATSLFIDSEDSSISVLGLPQGSVERDLLLWVTDMNNNEENPGRVVLDKTEVKTGEAIKITPVVAADGFNIGGMVKIWARTSDGLMATTTPLIVHIDVKIESVELILSTEPTPRMPTDKDPGNIIAPKDDVYNFVEGDFFYVSATVFPIRALRPYGLTNNIYTKQFNFKTWPVGDNSAYDTLFNVGASAAWTYDYASGRVTARVDVIGSATQAWNEAITVTIPRTFRARDDVWVPEGGQQNPPDDWVAERFASNEAELAVLPIEFDKIILKDSTLNGVPIDLEQVSIDLDIFKAVSLSALSMSNWSVDNILYILGVFLQPVRTSPINSNPLAEYINDLVISEVPASGQTGLLHILAVDNVHSTPDAATPNKVWTISANKTGTTWLEIFIIIGGVESTFNIPLTVSDTIAGLSFNASGYELEIEKSTFLENDPEGDGKIEVEYIIEANSPGLPLVNANEHVYLNIVSQVVGKPVSYTKLVYFVKGAVDTDGLAQPEVLTNERGGAIIETTQYGQVLYIQNKGLSNAVSHYSTYVSPLNSGTVELMAFLVRTNEFGQAVDINYEVLPEDSDWETYEEASLAPETHKGKFVVVSATSNSSRDSVNTGLRITVTEKLTNAEVYDSDGTGASPLGSNKLIIGTGPGNTQKFYIKGNSIGAIYDATAPRVNGLPTFGYTLNLPNSTGPGDLYVSDPKTENNRICLSITAYNDFGEFQLILFNLQKDTSGNYTIAHQLATVYLETADIAIDGVQVNSDLFKEDYSSYTGVRYLDIRYEIRDPSENELNILKPSSPDTKQPYVVDWFAIAPGGSPNTLFGNSNIFAPIGYTGTNGYQPSFPSCRFAAYEIPQSDIGWLADVESNIANITGSANETEIVSFYDDTDPVTGMPKFAIIPDPARGGEKAVIFVQAVANDTLNSSVYDFFLFVIDEMPEVQFDGLTPNILTGGLLNDVKILCNEANPGSGSVYIGLDVRLGNYKEAAGVGVGIGSLDKAKPGFAELIEINSTGALGIKAEEIQGGGGLRNTLSLRSGQTIGSSGESITFEVWVTLFVGYKYVRNNTTGKYDPVPVFITYKSALVTLQVTQ
ncbi:MAG: hypothetical protein FWE53_01035 [Firmicutes bacterium]|nr:hypothetical protein [Bacillota bacterium]